MSTRVPAFALAVIAALAFAPSVSRTWIYDDHALIEHDVRAHSLGAWPRWFTTDFWDTGENLVQVADRVQYWRPAISATYALDWTLSAGDPRFFHVMNLLWHALAAVLVLGLLRRWIGGTWGPAFAGAVLFAVHPVKAENVAWISGRTDVVCLVAVLVAVHGLARRLRGERGGIALEIAGTAAAYMCKEQAIVLPLFAAVEAWVVAGRPPIGRGLVRPVLRAALPQLAVAIAYLVARAVVLPIDANAAFSASLTLHLELMLESFGRFFVLTFAPHALSVQHGLLHSTHGEVLISPGYIAIGAVGLAAIVGVAVALRRRVPAIAVGLGFYLAAMVPTANVKLAQTATLISERFLYVPSIGLALVVGYLIERASPLDRRRAYAVVAAVAVALGAMSLSRSVDYRDESAFWERERALHPDSEIALHYALEEHVSDNHFKEALEVLGAMQQMHADFDHTAHDDLEAAYLVASIGSRLVPDRDRPTLTQFDEFVRTLLEGGHAVAVLDTRSLHFKLNMRRTDFPPAVENFAARLLVLRAVIRSRLGDDEVAMALAARAGERCLTCSTIRGLELEVLAGAGRYDLADALAARLLTRSDTALLAGAIRDLDAARAAHREAIAATGATSARARARELGALGLWGRAYTALAPYRAEVPAAELAEVAFKAGDDTAARALLGDTPETARQLGAWSREHGLGAMSEPTSEPPAIRPAVLLVVAAILAAVVYVPSFSGDWVYDDHPLIAANPYVHSLASWTRWFTTDFWDVNEEMVRYGHRIIYWRPGISATYAVDWLLGGGAPAFFHVMNLVWQAVMGALAFHVLKRWIGAAIPALVVAILFSIHPTKAESVAWIAGRTDVLCMVFVLIATEGMARRRRGARGGLALEILGTIAAYLCKEQAIVLPVFAMVEEWVHRDRAALDRPTLRAMIRAALPQGILAIAYLAIRAAVLPIGAANLEGGVPLSTHVWAILETYGRFTSLVVAPHEMSIQQGLVHVTGSQQVSWLHAALGAVTLAGVAALILGCRRRRPEISIGLGFYMLTLLPTSNLKYMQMRTLVSERFLYLPLLGVALVAGFALHRAAPAWRRRGYVLALAIGVAFAAVSLSRSADFRDEQQFWTRELELHPDSELAYDNMVEFAVFRGEYRKALGLLAHSHDGRNTFDRDVRDELRRATLTATVAAHLIPDHDKQGLRNIDEFCATLLAADKPKATLVIPDGRLVVDTTVKQYPTARAEVAPRLLALRAALASRLGEDARAVDLAEQAVAACRSCLSTVPIAIVALAAAGNYDRAEALFASLRGHASDEAVEHVGKRLHAARAAHATSLTATDPAALRARASEYTSLELWGRAFDVLAPYVQELKAAPRIGLGAAELAFRCGEREIARELLIATSP